jgi:hypothetical protein
MTVRRDEVLLAADAGATVVTPELGSWSGAGEDGELGDGVVVALVALALDVGDGKAAQAARPCA